MARKLFVAGVFVMAAAFGVLGYQTLTYYFYGNWPPVSFQFVYEQLFGPLPVMDPGWQNDTVRYVGRQPISLIGFVVCYFLLMFSDLLRGDGRRQTSV